jgi:hypothetical protein
MFTLQSWMSAERKTLRVVATSPELGDDRMQRFSPTPEIDLHGLVITLGMLMPFSSFHWRSGGSGYVNELPRKDHECCLPAGSHQPGQSLGWWPSRRRPSSTQTYRRSGRQRVRGLGTQPQWRHPALCPRRDGRRRRQNVNATLTTETQVRRRFSSGGAVARPEGFEPPTVGLEVRCSIRLSYGRRSIDLSVRTPER